MNVLVVSSFWLMITKIDPEHLKKWFLHIVPHIQNDDGCNGNGDTNHNITKLTENFLLLGHDMCYVEF
jgi:hypothetical protein